MKPSPVFAPAYDHVVSERGDLETVFLTLTGRKLRD